MIDARTGAQLLFTGGPEKPIVDTFWCVLHYCFYLCLWRRRDAPLRRHFPPTERSRCGEGRFRPDRKTTHMPELGSSHTAKWLESRCELEIYLDSKTPLHRSAWARC